MGFGDGIRRNIAHVSPEERAALRDAFLELNRRFYPGSRTDSLPGGVSLWFKQDEIHRWASHVHGGSGMVAGQPIFLPWHRVIVNRLEALLRQVDPRLSLHYWDWTQDPRRIPDADLGGTRGELNLFTDDFMGYGGEARADIGEPWLRGGFYVPGAAAYRSDDPNDHLNNNPADPPQRVRRSVGRDSGPAGRGDDEDLLVQTDYAQMRQRLESVHDRMHGFVNMGPVHRSFRDPFVFLLHANVDRLFARWQTDPDHPARLTPEGVYGPEAGAAVIQHPVEPWAGPLPRGPGIRPWAPPDNEEEPEAYRDYKSTQIVAPPCYDTNHDHIGVVEVQNPFNAATGRHRVHFNSVPEGETTWRAAVIRIFGCQAVTLTVPPEAAPTRPLRVVTDHLHVAPEPRAYVDAKIWFAYRAETLRSPFTDTTWIHCEPGNRDFPIELYVETIVQPSVALLLALDQSGSMSEPAGVTGLTRLQVLKDAARRLATLIPPGNGLGIVRFDHDAYPPGHARFGGMRVFRVAHRGMTDSTREDARAVIEAHGAHGGTSIADGLEMAQAELRGIGPGVYGHQAILLFTDGIQMHPKWIHELAPIDIPTFAVGLGNEAQVDTRNLTAITSSSGGYLLQSGLLGSSPEDRYRVDKFFLQILAGVTGRTLVLDPTGYLMPDIRVRIPFPLSEADIDCRVILLADARRVRLSLETPDGEVVEPGSAGASVEFDATTDLKTAWFTLPATAPGGEIRTGIWHALLELEPAFEQDPGDDRKQADANGADYCLTVHSLSNLRMEARAEQQGFTPGSAIHLRARLSEYDVPVERRAAVRAEIVRPDGTADIVPLAETGPGLFEAAFPTSLSGVYRVLVRAEGVTFRGTPFSREQLLTAAALHEIAPPIADAGGLAGGAGQLAEIIARCCRRMTILAAVTILLLLVLLWALLRG